MPDSATPAPALQRLRAVVFGEVQGVGFRDFTRREALRLGLTGWVQNTWEGTVETTAEGPQPALLAFEQVLRTGPRAAFVERVEVVYEAATGELSGFHIRY